ncbi:MAG: hypothetical protein ACTHKQ_24780 [Mesorhizobium sp.]
MDFFGKFLEGAFAADEIESGGELLPASHFLIDEECDRAGLLHEGHEGVVVFLPGCHLPLLSRLPRLCGLFRQIGPRGFFVAV